MRKLATVRRIVEIKSIPGADKICAYRVDGWWVVDSIGKYKVDDLAIYCETDSWIPTEIAPFLSKGKEPREFNGINGERLITIKLKKQISQGLLIQVDSTNYEGDDLTDFLGIQKYESPIPAQFVGQMKGTFPEFIPKTDQERIQNLGSELQQWAKEEDEWEVTEKLEGSSMTAFLRNGEFGVCSRNIELKEDENNSFWNIARSRNIEEKLRKIGRNFALQGELVGEGIQKNIYGIKGREFYLFDIYDIDNGFYLKPNDRVSLAVLMGIYHCPIVATIRLSSETQDSLLSMAEGKSRISDLVEREGLVFKCKTKDASFKCISNAYLLETC